MRITRIIFVVLLGSLICFSPAYAIAQSSAVNICKKNDFMAFFKSYAESPGQKQFEYVKFPVKVVGNEGNPLGSMQMNDFSGKVIWSAKEVQAMNRKAKTTFSYHIRKRGTNYIAMWAEENSSYVEAFLFKWENKCWKLIERHVNDTGI